MNTRRKSREFLLQSLYARAELGTSYDRESFTESFFSEDNSFDIETTYVDTLEDAILKHEKELVEMIALLAPKFDLATLPVLHILIIMISLAEILYVPSLDIPPAVSVNEAIELAKRFSDESGKQFINWALSTFLKEKEKIMLGAKAVEFRVFG